MFYHIVSGRSYGPAEDGESFPQYKTRVKEAYGSLRGVRFVQMDPGANCDPIYVVTGQTTQGRLV